MAGKGLSGPFGVPNPQGCHPIPPFRSSDLAIQALGGPHSIFSYHVANGQGQGELRRGPDGGGRGPSGSGPRGVLQGGRGGTFHRSGRPRMGRGAAPTLRILCTPFIPERLRHFRAYLEDPSESRFWACPWGVHGPCRCTRFPDRYPLEAVLAPIWGLALSHMSI